MNFVIPVSASDHTWFDKWRIWEIDGSTWLNHQDYFISISGEDYVGLVCAAMAINQDFRSVFTDVPYSFPEIDLQHNNGNTWYGSTVAMRVGTLTRRSGNTAQYVGAHYIGSSSSVNWSTFFFPEAQSYFSTGNANYKLAADNNADLMVYVPGSNPAADSVLGQLNQLNSTLSQLSSLQTTSNTTLSSIYTSIGSANTSLNAMSTKLTDINTKLQNIYTHINNLESLVSTNNDILDNVRDYVTDYFPNFDDDLSNISDNLLTFYNDFVDYAQDVKDYLHSIDQNLISIDENLDQFLELYNGTPLQQVPVRNSSSPNLWGLIKNGVSAGLNGFGQLFDLIFNAIGWFGSDVNNGFDAFGSFDSFLTVPYSPHTLVSPTEILDLPNFNYRTNALNFVCTDNVITVYTTTSGYGTYTYHVNQAYNLTPGTYEFTSTDNSKVTCYLAGPDETLVTRSGTFEVSHDMEVNLYITASRNGVYNTSFTPSLMKVG